MIAITGANGLLGSFIVRKLVEEKIPFVALKRRNSDISLLADVQHSITWRDADIVNLIELGDALEGVTHVIHAAAVVSYNPRRAKFVMNGNVQGTRNLVDACLAYGVKRLVHISSVAALGRQKNQKFIDETNTWIDNPLNSTYARSKYLAELEVFRGQEEGLSTVTINPSVILAPTNWFKSSAQLFRYVWEERLFYTEGSLNYVDVRDVVEIVYALLTSSQEAERFIVNAGKVSYKTFFDTTATQFGKRPPGIKLGATLLHFVARIESIRTLFSKQEPLITKETARMVGNDFLYSNNKIKKVLAFDFQPFDATIAWCCHSYMSKRG